MPDSPVSLTVQAETISDGNFEYNVNDDKETVIITRYTGSGGEVTIPSEINGKAVTGIGKTAFSGCTDLTSVIIPDSVTKIGYRAFEDCTGLTSVNIPNSVTKIGDYAFQKCTGLTSATIPNSVTEFGQAAFYECSGLTSVTISNNVTKIANSMFSYCTGLTTITIPDSVTSIGNYVFNGYTGLTSITIPDSVTEIGNNVIRDCNKLEEIIYYGTEESFQKIEMDTYTKEKEKFLPLVKYEAKPESKPDASSSESPVTEEPETGSEAGDSSDTAKTATQKDTPETAKTPDTASQQAGSSDSMTVIIIMAVIIGVLAGVLIVGGIVVVLLMKKAKNKQPFCPPLCVPRMLPSQRRLPAVPVDDSGQQEPPACSGSVRSGRGVVFRKKVGTFGIVWLLRQTKTDDRLRCKQIDFRKGGGGEPTKPPAHS